MKTKFTNFINKNKFITFSFTFFLLFGITINVFATPPSSPYGAGDTLDPSCAPGDSNCYVSGVSFFNYGDNGTVTTTGQNTFVGINSGNNTMGSTATQTYHASLNTAVGYSTLNSNTTGYENTAFGYDPLYSNTTGRNNTAVGKGTLYSNTTGVENLGVGSYTLLLNTTGSYNTAVSGRAALWKLVDGDANSAFGWGALGLGTTGDYNIGIGYLAGEQAFTGDKNIAIGYNVEWPSDSGSQQLTIGNLIFGTGLDGTGKTLSTGKIGIRNNAPAYTLHVGTSAVSGIVARFENSTGTCDINPTTTSLSCSSDETLKTNIESIEDSSLDIIRDLRPVTYNWLTQPNQDTIPGFIAQEVETLLPKLVNTDPNTNLKSLNYTLFTPYIVKSIQELDITLQGIESLDENSTFVSNLKNWFASATNGIEEFFTKKIHTEQLCVKKADGSEICVTGDDLEYALSSQGISYTYTTPDNSEEENIEDHTSDTGDEEQEEVTEEEVTDQQDEEDDQSQNDESQNQDQSEDAQN